MAIFWWDSVDVDNTIMRNIVIISSGSFGAAAFLVRCRELFLPLCSTNSDLQPKPMSPAGGGPGGARESSYGRAWSPFRSSSSAADSTLEEPPMDPRCSSISDITLDEAIRTPRHR